MPYDTRSSHGQRVDSEFRPHPLLRNPHLQTVVAGQLRPAVSLVQRPERCDVPDGDFIDLAWSGPDGGALVVLLHGLTGNFDSGYACALARRLHALGCGTVQMRFRGAGGVPNRADRAYHSGDTGDVAWLLDELAGRFPGRPLFAVGWSMGGNVLLKYLGERGDTAPLHGAAAVSVPFRLRDGAVRMRDGFSRIYQSRLLRDLKQGVQRKFSDRPCPVDLDAVLESRDFFEFDDRITAPLNGFADAEDYYARCSSRGFLRAIRRPTLILHALDDPFLSPEVVPEASELSSSIRLEVSPHGGHVAFIGAGPRGRPRWWMDERLAEQIGAWL